MTVDLYTRVSTEDQAKHGLSIDTQLDNLRAWAKENGHTIAGEYIDAGISGKKPLSKRPALFRWIQEVEAGRKVDALVFTKLDRFFRSVKLYYQATAIMDAHGIAWQAIQEDYETITSAGRFKVNIMLSVAEAEADRTSERIKVVFERKVAMGEALGSIMPLGLERKDKKVIPSEDADIVRECFKIFLQTASVYKVQRYLLEIGHTISYPATARILHNPLYCGHFRGNNSFCEPIISIADWTDAQRIFENRSIRENQTKRIYIFSGIIRCAECGRRMAGAWIAKSKRMTYRCNRHHIEKTCSNQLHVRESEVEAWLLDNIASELSRVYSSQRAKSKKKRGPDKATIEAKLNRLKDLYVDGLITKEQFLTDQARLTAQIPEPEKDLSVARQIVIQGDFRERYNELCQEDKRSLWRSVIDHIEADREGKLTIYFLP